MSLDPCTRMSKDCADRNGRGYCEASPYVKHECNKWARNQNNKDKCRLCGQPADEYSGGLCYGCNSGQFIKVR